MPIDYSTYSKDWKLRSRFIRFFRAKNCCEVCGAENYQPHPITGSKVILTVAHLDHDIRNNSFFNLKAMCQKCHLTYDAIHHVQSRKKRIFKNQLQINFNEGKSSEWRRNERITSQLLYITNTAKHRNNQKLKLWKSESMYKCIPKIYD